MLESSITRTTGNNSGMFDNKLAAQRRRKSVKRRSNQMAWLVVEGQNQGFHCNLREFSDKGAHLTVPGLMGIPESFLLYVEPDSVKYDCRVILRKGNSVRVDFVSVTENVRYRDLASRR